jgi:hypothetical protein
VVVDPDRAMAVAELGMPAAVARRGRGGFDRERLRVLAADREREVRRPTGRTLATGHRRQVRVEVRLEQPHRRLAAQEPRLIPRDTWQAFVHDELDAGEPTVSPAQALTTARTVMPLAGTGGPDGGTIVGVHACSTVTVRGAGRDVRAPCCGHRARCRRSHRAEAR